MKKIYEGIIVSGKMAKTIVVDAVFIKKHPVYKKPIKIRRKIKADTGSFSVQMGDKVKIVETRPISKDKHFKIMEVIKSGSA